MEIKYFNPKDLKDYENNVKIHPRSQIKTIIKNIEKAGFYNPLIITPDLMIIAGHGRKIAAIQSGIEEVPCIILEVDENTANLIRLADNKTGDMGIYDPDKLLEELSSFDRDDLSFTGYSVDELDNLLKDLEDKNNKDKDNILGEYGEEYDTDDIDDRYNKEKDKENIKENKDYNPKHNEFKGNEDDIPEIYEDPDKSDSESSYISKVKLGDIWQLGRHYILCGDSTIENNIKELIGDNQIELLFTSPPYSDLRNYEDGTDVSIDKLSKIFSAWNEYVNYFTINLGLKFKDAEVVEYWQEWIESAKKQGLKLLAWNIWDKTETGSIASACNMFALTHEWLFVFGESRKRLNRIVPNQMDKYKARHGDDLLEKGVQGKSIREKDGSLSRTSSVVYTHHQIHSVIRQIPEKGSIRKDHPAIMPVGLPQQYIESLTDEDEFVADPFLGSGSTLIACEKTNRTCFGCELSERYCDVILRRFESLTGKEVIWIRNIYD